MAANKTQKLQIFKPIKLVKLIMMSTASALKWYVTSNTHNLPWKSFQ